MRTNQYHSSSQCRALLGAASSSGLGGQSYLPLGEGQAERLACRKWQPMQFPSRSPAPLSGQGPKAREKKSGSSNSGITMPLTRKSYPGPSREKTNTITTPVWPCELLCGLIADEAEFLPLPTGTGWIWAGVPLLWRGAYRGYLMPPNRFARDERKSSRLRVCQE